MLHPTASSTLALITVACSLSAAIAVAGRGRGPADPVLLSRAEAADVVRRIEQDRADTERWLRSEPTSYLATIARQNFEDKTTLRVGRAPDNDVRIDADGVAAHHLRVTVRGDRFAVAAVDAGATFSVKEQLMREALLEPSYIKVDRFLLRLSHQRFPAIIVFDPRSPRFKAYKGLRYYPPDLSFRFELPLTVNPKPERLTILSTQGTPRQAMRVGWFEFVVAGRPVRLEATRLLEPGVGENDLSVFFRDTTSGHETYTLGRYVDPTRTDRGTYILDFNAAYNPACAFSDHYNCPIPPRANTLSVAIRAGEQDSHYY
ncbi:MAG: DUF1684 domain-containing protein [Vicinamibacterales bacterium]